MRFAFRGLFVSRCTILVLGYWAASSSAAAQAPSFACEKVAVGSIAEIVCQDSRLSALDRTLSEVYAQASRKAVNEHPPVLQAEQSGWIKGRDECWKSEDRKACVEDEYRRRIAELQARYQLLPGTGPVTWVCDGNPVNEVITTFYPTDPPTMIAERGDSTALMYIKRSASGAKYQGSNETFWEHHGEALITWGYGAPEMRCIKR